MIINHASKILFNIFFPEFDIFIKKISKTNYAPTPLSESSNNLDSTNISFEIKSHLKTFQFYIKLENFSNIEIEIFKEYIISSIYQRINLLQIILKKDLDHQSINAFVHDLNTTNFKSIQISLMEEEKEEESFIKFYLPNNFLQLFVGKIEQNLNIEEIEKKIIEFFQNPKWAIPDLNILIKNLNEKELSNLFNKMKQKNLFSVYQIFLLTKACSYIWKSPDLNLKIKKSLSKNQVFDVVQFKKYEKELKLTKRDLYEGIYSIEEGIYFLLKEDSDFFYSIFLKKVQQIIKNLLNFQLLEIKSFKEWICEMVETNLFYDIISVTKENLLAAAISRDLDYFLPILKNHVSQSKINSIIKYEQILTHQEWMESQISIIKNYKKIRFRKSGIDHNSFEYLLVSFENSEEYIYIINNVGWFILSTALKEVKKKVVTNVISRFTPHIKNLIEDVLKGSINPNILHDEIQINKARMICVQAILNLYKDGIIKLDLK